MNRAMHVDNLLRVFPFSQVIFPQYTGSVIGDNGIREDAMSLNDLCPEKFFIFFLKGRSYNNVSEQHSPNDSFLDKSACSF